MGRSHLVCAAALAVACGGSVAVENPANLDAGSAFDARDAESDGPPACEPRGGRCVSAGATLPSNWVNVDPSEGVCPGTDVCWFRRGSSTTVCSVDQDCNSNASVSALWGSCFMGFCFCKAGFYVQRSGTCGPEPPPDCAGQLGTCHQTAASCPDGMVAADDRTNFSCGDFDPAVCCFPASFCKGPSGFTCCAPNDAGRAPICVNSYLACPEGYAPTPGTCG